MSSDETAQLIYDRGPPLVFVAGEQEHGGAYVFVDLSQMVSEWTEIFELIGLTLHKTEEHMGLDEALGTELAGQLRAVLTGGVKALLKGSQHSCDGGAAAEHWNEIRTLHLHGSRISGHRVHISHLSPLRSVPLYRKQSNL